MATPKRGNPDFTLLFLTLALVVFGVVMVFSSSFSVSSEQHDGDYLYFTRKQIQWAVLGLIAMLFTMNLPFQVYQKWAPHITVGTLLLMTTVFLPGIGTEVNGARSWIRLGSYTLQPAEFAKIGLILYLANILTKKEGRVADFKRGLLPILIMISLFTFLLLLQPDMGTAIVILAMSLIVIICGGAKLKHLAMIGIPIAALLLFAGMNMEHVRDRFTSFLDPWADPYNSGYNLIQSMYAFGHGGLTGTGLGQGIQKHGYLPYPQTDFIFSIIGEELGFIGVFICIATYIFFIWRALFITLRSESVFGSLVGMGVISIIFLQIAINIGGATGALPITGVTLPFISYGGSSLFALMTSVGILLSISRETTLKQAKGK